MAETCTRPSWWTPMSTKAPNAATLVTTPSRTMPGARSSRVCTPSANAAVVNAGRGSRPGFSSSARMSLTVGRPKRSLVNCWGRRERRIAAFPISSGMPTPFTQSSTTASSDRDSFASDRSCWYWPTPMDLGSILTSSASGSCRRRAMDTAPRRDTSMPGSSREAYSDAEYTEAPASETMILVSFSSGCDLIRSAASRSVSREAVPVPVAISSAPRAAASQAAGAPCPAARAGEPVIARPAPVGDAEMPRDLRLVVTEPAARPRGRGAIRGHLPRIKLEVEDPLLFSAQHGQDPVRRQPGEGLGELEIVRELGARLLLAVPYPRDEPAARPHPLPEHADQVGVLGEALGEDRPRPVQRRRRVGDAPRGVHVGRGRPMRIAPRVPHKAPGHPPP